MVTQFLSAAIKFLGVDYPKRLAIGFLTAIAAERGLVAFRALHPEEPLLIYLNEFGFIGILTVTLLISFAPLIVWRRDAVPERTETLLNNVDAVLGRMNASSVQRNLVYNQLLTKMIATFDPQEIPRLESVAEDVLRSLEEEKPQ